MNEYSRELKSKLEQVEEYVVHRETPRMTNVFPVDGEVEVPKRMLTVRNVFWVIAIMIVGVSVVAFFTQAALLVVDNAKARYGHADTVAAQVESGTPAATSTPAQAMYVRADLERPVFEKEEPATTTATTTATSTLATATSTATSTATTTVATATSTPFLDIAVRQIPKSIELGIPGVTRIGYDESIGDAALSENINKYSNSTLVLGGSLDADSKGTRMTIGGGDEVEMHQYRELPKAIQPVLSSKAYLAADLLTGEIIIEKNSDSIYPLASVSKLMTALIAREKMNMQDIAIVSRDASNAYGAQGSLALGEKIRLRDLLFPLLMESSNDAAEVFADQYGHAKFMEEMNKKATTLSMYDTYYGDPSGLDPQNSSTPKDLLVLARHIYFNDPEIFDITRVKQFSIKGHTWNNANRLLPVAGFAGGKNGFIDQALQTTVSLFEVPLAKGGVRTVVVVILKSNTKDADVAKLLNYLKKSVEYRVE